MSTTYQFVIQGHLDEKWTQYLDADSLRHDIEDNTIIEISIFDQPALHGILERIRDFNLTLISIKKIKPKT